jgi:hypothetical protein
LIADRTVLFLSRAALFCPMRLICDLIFANLKLVSFP